VPTSGNYFHLHLVSDSTGETLITVARAVAAQYANVTPVEHVWNQLALTWGIQPVLVPMVGHTDEMTVYQTSPDGTIPSPDASSVVQDLKSSNPENPAVFIDRPVEAQGPVYTDIDGSSDNTFDILPKPIDGAAWIATRRLSDPKLKTDLSFLVKKEATVSVLFSKGTFPTVTLKQPDPGMIQAAADLSAKLKAAGFADTKQQAIWRDHDLNRANASLWTRKVKAGERVSIPGETLDYVVLVDAESE